MRRRKSRRRHGETIFGSRIVETNQSGCLAFGLNRVFWDLIHVFYPGCLPTEYFGRLTFQAVALLPCPDRRLTHKRIIIIQINNHGRNVTDIRSTCWTCVSCLLGLSLVATTTTIPNTVSRDGHPI